MHIAVRNNFGKISVVTDGIAMYYRQVDVNKNFTLRAKVRVNKIFLKRPGIVWTYGKG